MDEIKKSQSFYNANNNKIYDGDFCGINVIYVCLKWIE